MPVTIKTGLMKYKSPTTGEYVPINAVGDESFATIAPAYEDLSFPIKKGTYCYSDGELYISKQRIANSEPWTPAHWDKVTVASELEGKIDEPSTDGTAGQVLTTDGNGGRSWTTVQGGGGGGGTSNYNDLSNKPQIGGVTLAGNKSLADLGAAAASDVSAKYTKPAGGIPATDLSSAVQTSLGKADTALQGSDVATAVDAWLETNITNPDSPPLDRTLSIANAAAPADMVGDLKNETTTIETDLYISGKNIYDASTVAWKNATLSNGNLVPLDTGKANASTETYIETDPGETYTISWTAVDLNCSMYIEGYDSSKAWVSRQVDGATMNAVTRSKTFTLGNTVKYIRIRIYRSGANWETIIPNNIQIEKGSSATEYEPFGSTCKIYEVEETLEDLQDQINENPALTQRKEIGSDVNLLGTLVNGYLTNDGSFNTTTSGWYRSDYIPVKPGMFIWFYNINPWSYFGFFDSSKEWIGGRDIETPVGNNGNMLMTHQVPSGASYMIVSLEDTRAATCWGNYTPTIPTGKLIYANKETLRSSEYFPENPCDYEGMDVCTFRKGICIGDSITGGGFNYSSGTDPWTDGNVYSYPSQFSKMTGIEIDNEGHSGKTTVQWWNKYGTGGDSEIDFSGYDFAIIHLGINDVSYSVDIEDTTAAYSNIINALKNANEGIKIFVCTIIPAYALPITNAYDAVNNMVKTFASTLQNVYLCDLTQYGHEYINSAYAAGHLTAYGYWRLAKDLIGYIGYIMQSKPDEFRFIHYIGTDMQYTPGS